ncbi:MAG TPA: hypothetical protein VEL31_28510 [Ktedonobacteraceae bacterium]|nr:hypothetical protein [Ktedonobacteraceae bacterium]
MSNSSLFPILNLKIPNLAVTAWIDVIRRVVVQAGAIVDQRSHVPEINADWQLLHRFEYDHFYNAWVGVAFRFRACATHSEDFTAIFQRTQGAARGEDMYREDDALFGFFVKGLSALESFYYSLYALGALIVMSKQEPKVPPSAQFPLLTHLVDPAQRSGPRRITPEETHRAYTQAFPGLPTTEFLDRILRDEMYKEWSQIRNILAHRVTSAGRTIELSPFGFPLNGPPLSVKPWGMDLPLDATTTTSRYTWLRETINTALEKTAGFAAQQLPYTEDQLDEWTNRP